VQVETTISGISELGRNLTALALLVPNISPPKMKKPGRGQGSTAAATRRRQQQQRHRTSPSLPSVVPRATQWGVSGKAAAFQSRGRQRELRRRKGGEHRRSTGRNLVSEYNPMRALGDSGGLHPKLDQQLSRQWPSLGGNNSSGNLGMRPGVGAKLPKAKIVRPGRD
jgi:hypothetical protein